MTVSKCTHSAAAITLHIQQGVIGTIAGNCNRFFIPKASLIVFGLFKGNNV